MVGFQLASLVKKNTFHLCASFLQCLCCIDPFYAALAGFSYQSWHWGLIMFGLAMFVKMKVLLYAPPLLLLLLKVLNISGVILALLRAREVSFHLELTTPVYPIKDVFEQRTNEVASMLPWVKSVKVTMLAQLTRPISNIMAVSRRKGGVEKSTTTINRAYTLAGMGAGVGIFDADVDGPNLPTMVSPEHRLLEMNPMCLGVKLVSFGFAGKSREVMQGPMVSGDSWKDDCVGTLSNSQSLRASTHLERTKTIFGHGALGASVGTDLSSTAPGKGKDRTGMKWDIDQRGSKYMVVRKLHANAKSILDHSKFSWDDTTGSITAKGDMWNLEYIFTAVTQKQGMGNLDDPECSSYRAIKDVDPSTTEEPRFGERLIDGSCAIQKLKKISTRYFIIKSLNHHNIRLSIQEGNWATQVINEPILEEAFDNSSRVILVFSVNMSGFFQGYAHMMSSVGCRWDNVWNQGTGGNSKLGVVLAWVLVRNCDGTSALFSTSSFTG
ncbi:hypothetical protein Nepgr_019685 [Nepenthes gracilis]|uniref:YTH domain-containing protein n=1 Tax=Nepenthes gracilis TaxID=150966 RepID=A0AAD3SVM7_NEPGR|nr:hypothetical protein Nepgr_019685 [Nepenthes gracilis]